MPIWAIILISLFLALDSVIVLFVVLKAAGHTTKTLRDAFPPTEPAPDAVRRNFQSIKLNVINLGYSVHLAADDRHLHVFPTRLGRWIGVESLSIPWDEIQVKGLGRWYGRANVRGTYLVAPRWCMQLATSENGADRQ